MNKLKHINESGILRYEDLVGYQDHQIVSMTLVQNSSVSMTLFAFDQYEEIATHETSGDAIVQVLDGKAAITIDDTSFEVAAGEVLVLPANVPHSVFAVERFKMLLTIVY